MTSKPLNTETQRHRDAQRTTGDHYGSTVILSNAKDLSLLPTAGGHLIPKMLRCAQHDKGALLLFSVSLCLCVEMVFSTGGQA